MANFTVYLKGYFKSFLNSHLFWFGEVRCPTGAPITEWQLCDRRAGGGLAGGGLKQAQGLVWGYGSEGKSVRLKDAREMEGRM